MKDEKIIEQIEETVEIEPEEKIEEKVEEVEEINTVVKGEVTGCVKLNVRRGAVKTSDVIEIIEEGDIVEINDNRSTEDWYRVRTEDGKEGFCMKEYITKLS